MFEIVGNGISLDGLARVVFIEGTPYPGHPGFTILRAGSCCIDILTGKVYIRTILPGFKLVLPLRPFSGGLGNVGEVIVSRASIFEYDAAVWFFEIFTDTVRHAFVVSAVHNGTDVEYDVKNRLKNGILPGLVIHVFIYDNRLSLGLFTDLPSSSVKGYRVFI